MFRQPFQKLIYRIRILDACQLVHFCRQRCLCLCIKREGSIDQFHIDTNTTVVDFLIQIELFPDKIRYGKTGKPLVNCQFRFHILLVVSLEGFPLVRSIGRCMKLRNAVNGSVWDTKILDESFALRHLLLLQLQSRTCGSKRGRQTERPAMNHGTLPADWTEIIADRISTHAVAAENLRMFLPQIFGKAYTFKVNIKGSLNYRLVHECRQDVFRYTVAV